MMFWSRLFFAFAFVVFSTDGGMPREAYEKVVTEQDLQRSLKNYEELYGDVPSSVNCKNDHRVVAKLICKNKYLSDMELLNNRAQVYAIENATKSEIEHQKYRGTIPAKCRSKATKSKIEKCIYEFFKKNINDALGGESPFAE